MPAINVSVAGFADVFAALAALPALVAEALAAAGERLSEDGTRYWRALVTVRTGRMRGSLSVRVVARGQAVHVYYYVAARGFYYRFQRQAREWDAALASYLAGRAPAVIGEELRRRIQ